MVCQICGKNSGFYPLCIDCNKLKEDGGVTKCESCGKWKKDSKPLCYNCWSNENKSPKHAPSNRELTETECEMCGNNSYGKPLCKDCYEMSLEGLLTKCENCGNWKEDDKPLCYDCWLKSKNIKKDKAPSTNDKPQIKYTHQNFREKHKEGLKVEQNMVY